ncbi:MAG: ATP-dependent DNA helicase RecG [Elusimicrobia bacterium RIFOXYA2_FULL_40_6]|nr:MAG: ATP-dependent DNA helicase RecG [Elusimicrobia bacterium RIFOXYA2_FULL_40_6]
MNTNPLVNPVNFLKGVGPKKAKLLSKLGINTISDLLTYFPKEYDDRRIYKKIAELKEDEKTTISGIVKLSDLMKISPYLWAFKAAISDSTGLIYATFYRKPNYKYDVFSKLKKDFAYGSKIILHGKIEKFYNSKQIKVEEYELVSEAFFGTIHTNRIVPVYPLTEGINSKFLRTLIKTASDKYSQFFPETLPEEIRKINKLIPAKKAIEQIHFPDEYTSLETAHRKLAYDEFLLIQLAMQFSRKQYIEKEKKHSYSIFKHFLTPFKNNLNFEFTNSQKKVINEIFCNMQLKHPMNRLLIGDVGSGKTVVALSAILLAIENGYQVAFMAPTEILAEQHFYTIRQFIDGLNIRTGLLTGSTSPSIKKTTIQELHKGEIDLIIGTHSLIEQNIKFKNLSLIVIDEQHKFGVAQRQLLREKSLTDTLIMTATPIPRTLALTVYGDLDISTLDEMPPGRLPVKTIQTTDKKAYEFIREEIKKGFQAYIVFPLVEESDKLELKSAVTQARHLAVSEFPGLRVGLLHGQLKGWEKEKIMLEFKENKFDILIATTVIEVGIDVPNANVIAIEHADRFGLATLHQLRGRVGRKSKMESFCLLIGTAKTEDSKVRIETMISTNDGFKIAERDMELRGHGEFFGTSQHGMSELKIGSITQDFDIITSAKKTAEEIVLNEKLLIDPEYLNLKNELMKKYAEKLSLFPVG